MKRREVNGIIKQREEIEIQLVSTADVSEVRQGKSEKLIDPSDTWRTSNHSESIDGKWREQYGIVRNSRTTNNSKEFCKIIEYIIS